MVDTITVSLAVVVTTASLYLLNKTLGVRRYANEPPYIPSLIPYFGHILGLLRQKMAYYKEVK